MQANGNKAAQQPVVHVALWLGIKHAVHYSTFPYDKEMLD